MGTQHAACECAGDTTRMRQYDMLQFADSMAHRSLRAAVMANVTAGYWWQKTVSGI